MFSLAGEGATYTYARTYNLADWQPCWSYFFSVVLFSQSLSILEGKAEVIPPICSLFQPNLTSGLPPPLMISPFYCQQQTITLWHSTRFLPHPLCSLIRSANPRLGPRVRGALADDWHIWQCILLFQPPNGSRANECANDSSSCQPPCEKKQNHISIIFMEEILEYSQVSLFLSDSRAYQA